MMLTSPDEDFAPHSKEEAAARADHAAELWSLWYAFDVPADASPNHTAPVGQTHTQHQLKGTTMDMDMDIDLTGDRSQVATGLTDWVAANKEEIAELPEEKQVDVMTNIYNALRIIEEDGTVTLTEDTSWTAFKDRPSSYLIPDVEKLAERAAVYADPAQAGHISTSVNGKAFDTYLVTGEVTDELQPVLPAFAQAYREMHDHELVAIPKEMDKYVAQWADKGLDPDVMRDRLITPVADPAETARFEREDIARLAAQQGMPERDLTAFARVAAEIREITFIEVDDYIGPPSPFTGVDFAVLQAESAGNRVDAVESWEKAADELVALSELKDQGKLTQAETETYDAFVPALVAQ